MESQHKIVSIAEMIIASLKLIKPIKKILLNVVNQVEIDYEDSMQKIKNLPCNSKKAMNLAFSKGWFFGWNHSLEEVFLLVEKLNRVDPIKIDEIMLEHHRKNLNFTEKDLIQRYPEREKVLSAAFTAHRSCGENGYFLSISVFLSQADGLLSTISKVYSPTKIIRGTEKTEVSFALSKKIEEESEPHDLLYPLFILHQHDLFKTASARKEFTKRTGENFTCLNRHQVLHGESYDYGTEINSLKAFSFLEFVGIHLPHTFEHHKIVLNGMSQDKISKMSDS